MRISKVLLICVFTIISAIALQTSSHAEPRFGPWLYYAPYYFPPDGCCLGYCFGPDDFRPRYRVTQPPYSQPRCWGMPTWSATGSISSEGLFTTANKPTRAVMAPVPPSSPPFSALTEPKVPAGISSPPPVRNQLSSGGGSLQQPQAITHPGPQTSDSGPRTVTRPLKWGQDRAR